MDSIDKNFKTINFDFHCRAGKQKYLIQILLAYGEIDLKQLAGYLGIPTSLLLDVSQGLCYLPEEPAYQLAGLFLVMFSE